MRRSDFVLLDPGGKQLRIECPGLDDQSLKITAVPRLRPQLNAAFAAPDFRGYSVKKLSGLIVSSHIIANILGSFADFHFMQRQR